MTMNETTQIRVENLDDLMIKYYRAFKSVALINTRGKVLAQMEAKPTELGTYLQFQLLQEALAHRWVTEQWQLSGIALQHGKTLTVWDNGTLKDFEVPAEPYKHLHLSEGSLRTERGALTSADMGVQDLYEAVSL